MIIPRSYIAELLDEGLEPWIADAAPVQNALDMCTGSGCLAILLAHHFPNADVDAADISSDALAVALRNVTEHGLQDRINLIRSDLMSNLTEKTYDLIISNPPYVTSMAMEELPPEYTHEPALALAGGDDGLDAVRIILDKAAPHPGAGRSAGGRGRPQPRRRRSGVSAPALHLAHDRRRARTACSCSSARTCRGHGLSRVGRAVGTAVNNAAPTHGALLQAEELPDAAHDLVGARAGRLRPRLGGQRGERRAVRRLARGDGLRQRLDELRTRAQDRLEVALVEAIAKHLAGGEHGGSPRLAGQQAHLADERRRLHAREPVPRRARRLVVDLDRSRGRARRATRPVRPGG